MRTNCAMLSDMDRGKFWTFDRTFGLAVALAGLAIGGVGLAYTIAGYYREEPPPVTVDPTPAEPAPSWFAIMQTDFGADLIAVGVLMLVAYVGVNFWKWRESNHIKKLAASESPPLPTAPGPKGQTFVTNIDFQGGGNSRAPKEFFHVTSAVTVDRLRFFIDVTKSEHPFSFSDRVRLPLIEVAEVVRGRDFKVPLLRSEEVLGRHFLAWETQPRASVGDVNQVRFVVIGPDGGEQHLGFILTVHRTHDDQFALHYLRQDELNFMNAWAER